MGARKDKRQARTEAELRYGSEADALTSVLSGLKSDHKASVTQAKRAANMLKASAEAGIPTLTNVFDKAIKASDAHAKASQTALDHLGPAADAYKAAQAYDAGAPVGKQKAAAIDELVSRAAAAPEERMQEVRALGSQYRSDRGKVLDQLSSNAKQAGLYASERYGELRGEAAKTRNANRQAALDRRATARNNKRTTHQQDINSQRSAGIDPKTGKPIPGGKLDPKAKPNKAKPKLNQNQINTGLDNISAARNMYQQASGQHGFSESGLRNSLLVGSIPLAGGKSQKIPQVKSDLQVTAGFELAQGNHRLSKPTYDKLRKRGYKVPPNWRPLGSSSTGAAKYPTGGSPTKSGVGGGPH